MFTLLCYFFLTFFGHKLKFKCFRFQAINIFGDKRNKEAAEKLAKEQELQKVHVKKEDIEIIVSSYCMSIHRIDFAASGTEPN